MRYGIFSDVHGNIEALLQALAWLRLKEVDAYLCLGDIVGYGADPCQAIEIIRDLGCTCIMGNHDWACTRQGSCAGFNPVARASIVWTNSVLGAGEKKFLNNLPFLYSTSHLFAVHACLPQPESFRYVYSVSDARRVLSQISQNICFIGHTHCPQVYCLEEKRMICLQDSSLPLARNKRYLINVGSTGQPRDNDARGCVCLYDTDKDIVILHRFQYNIKKAADRTIRVGLPVSLALRLYRGR